MSNKTCIIIGREYLERVRKKSFIFTTIVAPILMIALMALPGIMMLMSDGDDTRQVMVCDRTGIIAPQLESNKVAVFIPTDLEPDSAIALADAVLVIPEQIIQKDSQMTLLIDGTSSLRLEQYIAGEVNDIVENERIKALNMGDIRAVLDQVKADSPITARRVDKEDESSTSAMMSYALGIALSFILYMCLLLYGNMVMTSIIEEKSNRVLELMVGSVSPTQLMMGKILGIGLVAVTQILIWGVIIGVMSIFALPALMPEDVAMQAAAMQNGTLDMGTATIDTDLLGVLSVLSDAGYMLSILGVLLLFLIGGFMLYSAIFAAIGSAVDNIQDASQLQSVVTFPIVFGIVFSMMAAADPSSTLSFWTSIIPFTSPTVMLARIPYGIPAWQIIVSLILLYLTFVGMVWVAAKIYRIGIFMYGKKPTLKDLIRWVRYK